MSVKSIRVKSEKWRLILGCAVKIFNLRTSSDLPLDNLVARDKEGDGTRYKAGNFWKQINADFSKLLL